MDSSSARVTLFSTMRSETPARVAALLAALAEQDYEGELELVVAVPPDEAGTMRRLVAAWSRGPIAVVENPTGERSSGLNRAIACATGTYAIRLDARSRPAADYVRRCVARLEADPSVGVVGGVQAVQVGSEAPAVARGIGRALTNRWLLGNAQYRNPAAHGPVDTVYLGAFRRRELAALRYDERLTANEDFDLCERYRADGRQVWLESGLSVPYEPRSDLDALFTQYQEFGRSKVRYWKLSGHRPARRQRLALAAGIAAAAVGVIGARKPAVLGASAATLVAIYLATDAATDAATNPVPTPLTTRLAAVPAHVAIEAGWLSGIAIGLMEAA
jgi:Glycosyltransferases, probably involved in cell wall biogenesis